MKIQKIIAREILDSRGNPTVEVDVILEDESTGRASVPSGASTGKNEAIELKASKAVENVNTVIVGNILNKELNQKSLDEVLINLDSTPNKSNLGANAILAVSLAFAKAAAQSQKIPLFQYIRNLSKNPKEISLPVPLCNIINGGKHASGSTDIQEFMIAPIGAKTFKEAMQMLTEIFEKLGEAVKEKGYDTKLGDEGGYAPHLQGGNREALELISEAIQKAGYKPGSDVSLALDVAASELKEKYDIEYYKSLVGEFPIFSIEDPFAEDDWDNWVKMVAELDNPSTRSARSGHNLQIVGDDLLVTNVKFLQRAIREKAANAILIKPNQVGTLSETIDAVDMAHSAGWNTIISHRSGETMDTTIAHIAVGLGTGQIKTGSVSQPERIAKYNELLRIEKILGSKAKFVSL
jgi:enolase